MPPPLARDAHLGVTSRANTHFICVTFSLDDVGGLEDGVAVLRRAVCGVLHSILCKLLVPFSLEFAVE